MTSYLYGKSSHARVSLCLPCPSQRTDKGSTTQASGPLRNYGGWKEAARHFLSAEVRDL